MRRLVILGGAESGCGAAVLGKKKGWQVFLSDKGDIAPQYRDMLDHHGIEYEYGRHSEARILAADLVIKSPGIPDTVPIVQALLKKGVEVVSEIEFAGRYTKAETVCVTGSNGKTTTATLIYEILREAGFDVALAGNIGKSFALQVSESDREWYVLELSSFQLDGMREFKADIAVLTNITPDHLDRYDYNIDNYARSKLGIIRNQSYDDFFIYCEDDGNISSRLDTEEMPMRLLPFTSGGRVIRPAGHNHSDWQGARTDGGDFIAAVGERKFAMPVDELKIKGRHNIMNAMAATLAAMAAGAEDEPLRKALREFGGIEHRMEPTGEKNGVAFINDSKATNVDSVWYALDSIKGPVVWIAGGTDKGNDYSALDEVVRGRVHTLVDRKSVV